MKHLLLALTITLVAAQAQKPEVLLEAAKKKETVDGDLKAAIGLYEKVVAAAGSNRSAAAAALLRLGACHEKLGSLEARKAYERVVASFAEQPEAGQARTRLAALGSAPSAGTVRTRLVWDDAIDLWGTVSKDGRYLSFVDWSTCDLGLRDLVTGKNRKLTSRGCANYGEVEGSAISPDGKRIAYTYQRYRPWRGEFYVIGSDGTGDKLLMSGDDLNTVEPYSWSPDEKWIAAVATYAATNAKDKSYERRVVLIAPDTGQVRRFAARGDGDYPFNVFFSPDGKWIAYTVQTRGGGEEMYLRLVEGNDSGESKLLDNAVMVGWMPDGNGVLFSRRRGEVSDLYSLELAGGKPVGIPVPIYGVADVRGAKGITSDGTLLYGTNNRRAETLLLPWRGKSMEPQQATASIHSTDNIGWVLGNGASHFSHDGKRFFTVTPRPREDFLIRELATGREQLVRPRMKYWRSAQWAHDDSALLLRGASHDGKQGVFRMTLATGDAALVTELPESTWGFTISRDGKTLFYGEPGETFARDLATGAAKKLFGAMKGGNYSLHVSPEGNRLAIRASQSVAIVDLRTGQARTIYETEKPENSSEAIWGMDWSEQDGKLYGVVRVEGQMKAFELLIFSPDGGKPVRLPNPKELRGISISPDGRHALTTSMTQRWQLWALENFLPAGK